MTLHHHNIDSGCHECAVEDHASYQVEDSQTPPPDSDVGIVDAPHTLACAYHQWWSSTMATSPVLCGGHGFLK